MACEGHPVQVAVRVLGVPGAGFYAWRDRGPSARSIRHVMLTDTIRQIHAASNDVYGVRRVHAELTLGRGMRLWHADRGDAHVPGGPQRCHGPPEVAAGACGPGLDRPGGRQFSRKGLDQLWVTDITEHTNGLLRQYFPKSTDLSRWSAEELQAVVTTLNARPRKTLGWRTPAESYQEQLLSLAQAGVASTP